MPTINELSAAVQVRRAEMGLTQEALAKLSGLSRSTVIEVEKGTIKDLSLNRASRLASVLGLSVHIAPPHSRHVKSNVAKSTALDLASRTASVSYKTSIGAARLAQALTSGTVPSGFLPHMYTLLDEAPTSLLASVVEQLHQDHGLERKQVWKNMRQLAIRLKSSRDIWQ